MKATIVDDNRVRFRESHAARTAAITETKPGALSPVGGRVPGLGSVWLAKTDSNEYILPDRFRMKVEGF